MNAGEVVFRELESEGKKNVERVEDLGVEALHTEYPLDPTSGYDEYMTHPCELLNLWEMFLDTRWMLVLEVSVEL